MSEEVNKEQTKGATQDKIPELADDQLDEVAAGRSTDNTGDPPREKVDRYSGGDPDEKQVYAYNWHEQE